MAPVTRSWFGRLGSIWNGTNAPGHRNCSPLMATASNTCGAEGVITMSPSKMNRPPTSATVISFCTFLSPFGAGPDTLFVVVLEEERSPLELTISFPCVEFDIEFFLLREY